MFAPIIGKALPSKGMEATGAARLLKIIFADGTVYVGEYVSDDDSSSRSTFTHSFQELIDARLMEKEA